MAGIRPGSGAQSALERYLIPSITVPPARAANDGGATLYQEAGNRLGLPEAASTNVGEVFVAVTGALPSDQSVDRVEVQCVESARVPGGVFLNAAEDILAGGEGGIDDVIGRIAKNAQSVGSQMAAPRVGVRRWITGQGSWEAGGSYVGVTTSFGSDPSKTFQDGSWVVQSEPVFVETPTALFVLFVVYKSSKYWLVVRKYDPSLPAAEGPWVATADFDLTTVDGQSLGVVDGMAAIYADGAIWVAMFDTPSGGSNYLTVVQVHDPHGTPALLMHAWRKLTFRSTSVTGQPYLRTGGRMALARTSAGFILAVSTTEGLALARSEDLRAWDTVNGLAAFAGLVSVTRTMEVGSGLDLGPVVPTLKHDGTWDMDTMWTVSSTGYVLRTADAGKSWTALATPMATLFPVAGPAPKVRLFSVAAYRPNGGLEVLYASGPRGTLLKSVDGGSTWVVQATKFLARSYDNASILSGARDYDFDGEIYRVRAISDQRAWACGAGGGIYYTSNGGTAWQIVRNLGSKRPYVDFVVDGVANDNRLFAIGEAGVHDASAVTDSAKRRTRAVLIKGAELPAGDPGQSVAYYLDADSNDTASLTSLAAYVAGGTTPLTASGTHFYVGTEQGGVYRLSGDNGATLPETPSVVATFVAAGKGQPVTGLTVDPSSSGTALWGVVSGKLVQVADATGTAKVAVMTFPATAARSVALDAGGEVVVVPGVGASPGLYRVDVEKVYREYPHLEVLDDGRVALCAYCPRDGTVEVYIAPPPAAGETPAFSLHATFSPNQTDPEATQPGALHGRPSLTRTDYGTYILMYGTNARQLIGDNWVAGNDSVVPLAINDHTPNSAYASSGSGWVSGTSGSRTLGWFLGSVWTAIVLGNRQGIGVWRAWEFSTGSTAFRPLVPGAPVPLGLGGLALVFDGSPAVGDRWTLVGDALFPARNLVVDTPSVYWKSRDASADIAVIWDRESSDITGRLGAHPKVWQFQAGALFDSSFPAASIATSNNGSSWTTYSGSSFIASGTATVSGTDSVLTDSGKSWVPHEFKPGTRRYYAWVSGKGAFPILDNDRTSLIIGGAPSSLGASVEYAIYGDRILIAPAALQSAIARVRYVKLLVPVSIPAGQMRSGANYSPVDSDAVMRHRIGSVRIGTMLGYQPYAGNERRRRFTNEYEWQASPSTLSEAGITGAAAVSHFGRPAQRVRLPYEAVRWHDRDMTLNPLLGAFRQGVAIQFDGGDPHSIELMRLSDAPAVRHIGGDRYSYEMVWEEIV